MADQTVAVIPARGGSKGIPGKNVRHVAGAPLITHSIRQAVEASLVDLVFVSTDDEEIAAISQRAGARVIERPDEFATDTATSESALRHSLDVITAEVGDPDLVVFLQPTSPLRRPWDVDGAVRRLRELEADSLFSANMLHAFVWQEGATGLQSLTYDHRSRPRRQDREVVDWVENGSIYVFKPWVLRDLDNRLGGTIGVYEMEMMSSFQVDEPADLVLMEAITTAHPGAFTAGPPAPRLADLDLLVFDFDGVLTDNGVLVDQDGVESVRCDRSDGLGIDHLRAAGLDMAILSTETNPVVAARARKLRLPVVQSSTDKGADIEQLAAERGVSLDRVGFVGNDVNDLPALERVAVAIAVADAVPAVLDVASWVTRTPGGRGAVRELAETLLADD